MYQKNNDSNKSKEGKKIKINIFYIILAVLLFLIFGQKIVNSNKVQVDYNDFLKKVNAGKVEIVDINKESGKVEYCLKDNNTVYFTNYPYTEDFQEKLLKKNVKIKFHETNWLITVLEVGITPLFLVVLILSLKNMMGDSEKYIVESKNKIQTRFSDVAGLDEVKEDLLFIAKMLKDKSYINSGARVPRGILLQGPPGNGKTLIARAFAGETGLNFIAINASDFGSKFVGVGSQKIKNLFETAKKSAPCVVFIDEIDSVGAKRSSYSDAASREMNSILTALLNQMDIHMFLSNDFFVLF